MFNDSVVLKLLLSFLVGSALGWERFVHGRPAGLRTHLLVCLASTLMMEIGLNFSRNYPGMGPELGHMVDPTRIASGVITGIGFLGAGVILRTRETVQGLTSAACIWMAAALGLAIGAGFYTEAILVTLLSLLALILLKEMEGRLTRDIYKTVIIEARDEKDLLEKIKNMATRGSVVIVSNAFQRIKQDKSIRIELMVKVKKERFLKEYCDSVFILEPVQGVSLERPFKTLSE